MRWKLKCVWKNLSSYEIWMFSYKTSTNWDECINVSCPWQQMKRITTVLDSQWNELFSEAYQLEDAIKLIYAEILSFWQLRQRRNCALLDVNTSSADSSYPSAGITIVSFVKKISEMPGKVLPTLDLWRPILSCSRYPREPIIVDRDIPHYGRVRETLHGFNTGRIELKNWSRWLCRWHFLRLQINSTSFLLTLDELAN